MMREESKRIDDGGPAFPSKIQFSGMGNCANSDAEIIGGMSLRDWFAGQALNCIAQGEYHPGSVFEAAAMAYEQADAMMKARK